MIDQFDEITPEIKENVAQSYRDAWGYEEIGFDATKLGITFIFWSFFFVFFLFHFTCCNCTNDKSHTSCC